MKDNKAWKKVVYSADCDEWGNCPVCAIDYAQCDCIGPTMDEKEVEYKWADDVLYGRLINAVSCQSGEPADPVR